MRLAEHDLSPSTRLHDMEARQQAAVEKVLPHVKLLDKGNFKKAVKALPHWTRAREATRDRAVRTGATLKRVFRELVRRAAAKGGVDGSAHGGDAEASTTSCRNTCAIRQASFR